MPLEKVPGAIALTEKRPTHGRIYIVGLDGVRRSISVTAMPLFAHPMEVVGMVAFFWEEGDLVIARVWGCRGSLPTPGEATVRYGGNTSCVEIRRDGRISLILDAGTGIKRLGDELDPGLEVHVLLDAPAPRPCGGASLLRAAVAPRG